MSVLSKIISESIVTRNTRFGFHGTVASAGHDADKTYSQVHREMMKNHNLSHDQARDYLDSTHGRHLADQFLDSPHKFDYSQSSIKKSVDSFKKTYNPKNYA